MSDNNRDDFVFRIKLLEQNITTSSGDIPVEAHVRWAIDFTLRPWGIENVSVYIKSLDVSYVDDKGAVKVRIFNASNGKVHISNNSTIPFYPRSVWYNETSYIVSF